MKGNNKGITLVELLLALAITTIILSAVSYLIFYSIRMYGKSNASVEMQNEAETTLNHITESIMQANGVTLQYDRTVESTDYVLFGTLEFREDIGFWTYYGSALICDVSGQRELYLTEFPNATYIQESPTQKYCRLTSSDPSNPGEAIAEIREYVLVGDGTTDHRKECLLTKNVDKCFIYVEDESQAYQSVSDSIVGISENRYIQPFTLKIKLEFSLDHGTGVVTRSVESKASVRSKVGRILVNGTWYEPLLN